MARPRKKIDPAQVEELSAIGCSYAEIAAVTGCNPSTLTRRFAQAIKDGHERLKCSVRRRQYEIMMSTGKGAATMAIWLGKQWLGQSDKQEVKQESSDINFGNLRLPSLSSNRSGEVNKPN